MISDVFSDITKWMTENHLRLNANKTIFLPISRKTHYANFKPLELGKSQITPVEYARNLGFIMSSDFSLDRQINQAIKTAFFQLRRIQTIRDRLPHKYLATLVHTFITSRLDYHNSLYHKIPIKLLNKLQLAQNAAAKMLLLRGRFSSASAALMELHWLPIRSRISFKLAVLGYKVYHKNLPKYFSNVIVKKSGARVTRSSALSLLESTAARPKLKSCGERCFFHQCESIWNSLPESLRMCSSVESFKSKLKTYLFELI